jgi:hypothetical protein
MLMECNSKSFLLLNSSRPEPANVYYVSHVAFTDDFWIQRTEDEEAISETTQLVEIGVEM